MDKRTYITGFSILFISAAVSFSIGSTVFGSQAPQRYSNFLNTTVNAEVSASKVNFDNNTLQLMYEDSPKARMYIDTNVDGSFDIELTGLKRDGLEHTITQIVTYNSTSYRLYFRYKDNRSVSDDGYLTLYQIQGL